MLSAAPPAARSPLLPGEAGAQVSQNGWLLLSRRGRSLPASAGGFDTHRDSITSRVEPLGHAKTSAPQLTRPAIQAIALPAPPTERALAEQRRLASYYDECTAVAFDLMSVNFADLDTLPLLKDPIRALFSSGGGEDEQEEEVHDDAAAINR
eukprot:COSAG01_NODE_8790_length_2657_cov_14.786943_1_plen_152_part_00